MEKEQPKIANYDFEIITKSTDNFSFIVSSSEVIDLPNESDIEQFKVRKKNSDKRLGQLIRKRSKSVHRSIKTLSKNNLSLDHLECKTSNLYLSTKKNLNRGLVDTNEPIKLLKVKSNIGSVEEIENRLIELCKSNASPDEIIKEFISDELRLK